MRYRATRMDRWRPCVVGVAKAAERQRLWRRVQSGEMVAPYRGVHAESEYWNSLDPRERAVHLMEALSRRHPRWVFAGLSAAAALGLDYTWSLLRDDHVYVGTVGSANRSKSHGALRYLHMPSCGPDEAVVPIPGGQVTLPITSPARVLADCARAYPFRLTLGMADSAFRRSLTTAEAVVAECDRMRGDCGAVFRMLHYADPLSENGGESLCRATLLEEGFARPSLQHEFVDPLNAWNKRRADFVWHARGGRCIVLEYDGTRKYVDPEMTGRRDIQDVVRRERERDSMLLRAGVSEVVHVTYDEVVDRRGLVAKLRQADVPAADLLPFYEREGRLLEVNGR